MVLAVVTILKRVTYVVYAPAYSMEECLYWLYIYMYNCNDYPVGYLQSEGLDKQANRGICAHMSTHTLVCCLSWMRTVRDSGLPFIFFTHTSQPWHYHSLISLHCSPLNTKLHPKKYWSGCEDSASKVLVLEKRPHALGWKHTQTHTHWHHHQWLV